jgi:hypothetical protein
LTIITNSLIANEQFHHTRWLIKNKKIISYIEFIFSKLYARVFQTRIRFDKKKYPLEIQYILSSTLQRPHVKWFADNLTPLSAAKNNFSVPQIALAGFNYYINSNKIKWDKSFSDGEDTEALHRWNWVLRLLSENVITNENLATWFSSQIEFWLDKYLPELQQPGFLEPLHWYPYTIGERISNTCIFFYLTGYRPSDKIVNGLGKQVQYLSNHLEFQGTKTGNHVVNNARALYIAGCLLKCKGWRELASSIFVNEVPKHITEDGFFREGSSHYQFLYTRWLLELYYFAHIFEDQKIKDFLAPICMKMLQQCNFFLVNDEQGNRIIPLFGDISPDYPPNWLIDLDYSVLAKVFRLKNKDEVNNNVHGWSNLWRDAKITDLFLFAQNNSIEDYLDKEGRPVKVLKRGRCYPKSGWYRLDFEQQSLFCRADKNGVPDYVGHHHQDIYHFCLFSNGIPVLVDSGRKSYEKKDDSSLTARAHNSLLIDNLESFPANRRIFAESYYKNNNTISWGNDMNSTYINIASDGFSRMTPSSYVERKIKLSHKKTSITDFFSGKNEHEVKTYFHWDSKVKIEVLGGNRWRIETEQQYGVFYLHPDDCSDVNIFCGGESPLGWMSYAYGEKIPAPTMEITTKLKFPNQKSYSLEWMV